MPGCKLLKRSNHWLDQIHQLSGGSIQPRSDASVFASSPFCFTLSGNVRIAASLRGSTRSTVVLVDLVQPIASPPGGFETLERTVASVRSEANKYGEVQMAVRQANPTGYRLFPADYRSGEKGRK